MIGRDGRNARRGRCRRSRRPDALDPVPDCVRALRRAVAQALGVERGAGLSSADRRAAGRRGRPERAEPAARTALPELLLRGRDRAVRPPAHRRRRPRGRSSARSATACSSCSRCIPIVAADVITEYRGERALEALREAQRPDGPGPSRRVVAESPAAEPRARRRRPAAGRRRRAGRPAPPAGRSAGHRSERADRRIGAGAGDASRPIRRTRRWPTAGRWRTPGRASSAGAARASSSRSAPATEVGRIAGGLGSRERRRSPLQPELDRLVRILLVVAIGLIAIVTGLGFARGQPAGANLLAGVSAAIAAIPEEPPVLLAVILGLGAYRLLRRGVLVRRLNAEETLGAIDLIVTDKTGTLTRNRLDVASVSDLAGPVEEPARLASCMRRCAPRTTPGSAARARRPARSRRRSSAPSRRPAGDPSLDRGRTARDRAGRRRPADLDATVRRDAVGPRGARHRRARGDPRARREPTARRGTPRWHDADRGTRGRRGAARGRRAPDGCGALVDPCARSASPTRCATASARRSRRRAIAGIEVIVVTGDHPLTAGGDRRPRQVSTASGSSSARSSPAGATSAWRRSCRGSRIVARSTPDQKERLVRLARGRGPHGRRDRRRRQRRAGAPPRGRRGRDGVGDRRRQGGGRPRPRRRLVRDADVRARPRAGGSSTTSRRACLPDLDPRGAARVHPHRDAVRLRPAAAAAPDPVAGAVHRPLDVGRVRAREGRARPDAPAATTGGASRC